MAINKTQADAMLNPFRQMVADGRAKGYTGELFDKICHILNEMEKLAQEMNDFAAFSAKLNTDGYFVSFSNEYGRLLNSVANNSNINNYDDQALLQQTLKMYEDSLKNINNHPNKEIIIKAINDIVHLGKSGINYPTFLRLMIEQGLDKALEGTAINRKYLAEDLALAQKTIQPAWERKAKAMLDKYDELAAQSSLHIPNITLFNLERFKIESDYTVDIQRYDHIKNVWQTIFMDLHWWIDAHTKFAFIDERYVGRNEAETRRNIELIKNIHPGKIQATENILQQNYLLGFNDIFKHETFDAEYRSCRFNYTEEYIYFIKDDVYSQCKPLQHANKILIEKAETLYHKALVKDVEECKKTRKAFVN